MSGQNFCLIATIRPLKEREADALAALAELVAATRTEPGCLQYDLLANESEECSYVMVERFASKDAWLAHMETPHVKAFQTLEASLVREPNSLSFFTPAI